MADEKKTATRTEAKAEPKKFNFAKLNSLAVVAFALSVGWVGAVAGVITGHFALAKIKATGERGRRLAIASLIIGYAYIGLSLLWGMFMAGLAIRGIIGHEYQQYGLRGQMGQVGFDQGFTGQTGMGQGQFDDHMRGHMGQFGPGQQDQGMMGGCFTTQDANGGNSTACRDLIAPNGTATAEPAPQN